MKRKIIQIDQEKCNGCGLCVQACHERAIEIFEHKARLIKEEYCDGLGDCLPHCPMDAIKIEVREVAPLENQNSKEKQSSELKQWPVQIKLIPATASYFKDSHLLLAASCTAYAYAHFHKEFMKKRVTLIGCPKLDGVDYSEKLSMILAMNSIKSITIVRMEVPCCKRLELDVEKAIQASGKTIPYSVRVISTKGELVECY